MAAAIPVAAAVAASAISSDASKSAANKQAAATNQANQGLQTQNFLDQQRLSPWTNSGTAANNLLSYYLGTGGSATGATDPNSLSGNWNGLVSQAGGAPEANMNLYNNNADYHKAWDQVVAANQANGGFNERTPANAINDQLKALLGNAYQTDLSKQQQGNSADPQFGSLLKQYTGQDLLNQDPGYQFRLDQGNKAINNAAAAGGRYDSGGALKALAQYGQNYASNEYNNAFNQNQTNKNQIYSMLSGQSQIGQNTALGAAAQGNQLTGQVANNTTAQGNAAGAASLAQGNAYQNALNSMASSYAYNNQNSGGAGMPSGGVSASGYNALGTQGTVGGTSSNPWYG